MSVLMIYKIISTRRLISTSLVLIALVLSFYSLLPCLECETEKETHSHRESPLFMKTYNHDDSFLGIRSISRRTSNASTESSSLDSDDTLSNDTKTDPFGVNVTKITLRNIDQTNSTQPLVEVRWIGAIYNHINKNSVLYDILMGFFFAFAFMLTFMTFFCCLTYCWTTCCCQKRQKQRKTRNRAEGESGILGGLFIPLEEVSIYSSLPFDDEEDPDRLEYGLHGEEFDDDDDYAFGVHKDRRYEENDITNAAEEYFKEKEEKEEDGNEDDNSSEDEEVHAEEDLLNIGEIEMRIVKTMENVDKVPGMS